MNEIDLDDYIKKMHENEDSAVKVIETNKKLLKEKTKLERKVRILQGKVDYLQDIIKEAIELLNNDGKYSDGDFEGRVFQNDVLEILKKSHIPTFDEVEELFIEQREEGFNV